QPARIRRWPARLQWPRQARPAVSCLVGLGPVLSCREQPLTLRCGNVGAGHQARANAHTLSGWPCCWRRRVARAIHARQAAPNTAPMSTAVADDEVLAQSPEAGASHPVRLVKGMAAVATAQSQSNSTAPREAPRRNAQAMLRKNTA